MDNKTKEIVLKNVTLRALRLEDAQNIFDNYATDPQITKYVTWDVHKSVQDTTDYLKSVIDQYKSNNFYHWVIVDNQTSQVIGAVGEVASKQTEKELGWVISREYWNKGIMTNAVKAVIKFLFQNTSLEKLTAKFASKNVASGKVMQKAGMYFAFVSEEPQPIKPNKPEKDHLVYYEITKKDFQKLNFFENAYEVFGNEWGFEAQIRMAVEESSELIKEIMKYIRYSKDAQPGNKDEKLKEIVKDLKQEVADTLNCVEQVKYLLDREEIEKIRREKIERTFNRIKNMKQEDK